MAFHAGTGPYDASSATLLLHFYRNGNTFLVEAGGGITTAMLYDRLDLPQGTLDLLILRALAAGPMHGWAISERLHQVSRERLQVPQGSLYPALHRLERQGLVDAEWGASDNNRRAKFYALTRAGRKRLAADTASWQRLVEAVQHVLAME